MRPPRRLASAKRRRGVPARSRLTVPRAVLALRQGRRAIADIEGQLDALLVLLREPRPRIAADAPERLAGAARQAGRALSALEDLRRLLP